MDDLDFLEQGAAADSSATSTLMVLLPNGSVTQIHNVDRFALLDKCPLLFHAFEFRESDDVEQASIEVSTVPSQSEFRCFRSSLYKATSRSAVIALLRFLYTGTYLLDPEVCLGSLLLHVEAFKIAEDFDVPEFQVQAYVNFTRETEFSCSNVTPPPDLCDTIEFIYHHFVDQDSQEHRSLLDTILNYCVSVFTYQVLGDRQDFRRIAFDNPTFHKDLCRTSMNRNFEDDGADEIVQLPVCRPTPHSQAALLKRAIDDFQYEIWQEGEEAVSESNDIGVSCSPSKKHKLSHGGFTLVHRPKKPGGVATFSGSDIDSESSSDELGFTLVERPKLPVKSEPTMNVPTTPDQFSTSSIAEHVPSVTIKPEPKEDVANLASDDEWAIV